MESATASREARRPAWLAGLVPLVVLAAAIALFVGLDAPGLERPGVPQEELAVLRPLFLLTMKPTIYAANVAEATLNAPDENEQVKAMREIAVNEEAECVVICAQLEADLVDLSPAERTEYLESLGVKSSGVDQLIKSAYRVLGLMSFLTAGEKEARAWTIAQGSRAQDAAGAIHSRGAGADRTPSRRIRLRWKRRSPMLVP